MKLTIKDGRDHFYTFDTNRILLLTATDEDMINQVEFSTEENGEEVSWTSEVLTGSDGVKYVQVPNEFLNGDYTRLVCYYVALDSNGEYTRQKEIFRIRARQEPQDYFLTYSERVTFASIKALTEQYKANASDSAELASKYAENNEDVAVEPGKYSAKHWSIKSNKKYEEIRSYVGSASDPESALGSIESARANAVSDVEKQETDSIEAVGTYTSNTAIPSVSQYVEGTAKPALKTYGEQQVDSYVNGTSKPELDRYVNNEKKQVLDDYTAEKKSELDNYTETDKKQILDSYTENEKKAELDSHTEGLKEQLNAHTVAKTGELNEYTTGLKSELDGYTTAKEQDISEFTEQKKLEVQGVYQNDLNELKGDLDTERNARIEVDTEHSARLQNVELASSVNRYEIDNLKAKAEGKLYRTETVEAEAYALDVPSSVAPYAEVQRIKGKSVVWNQILHNGNFVGTNYWKPRESTLSTLENELICEVKGGYGGFTAIEGEATVIAGHKYYLSIDVKTDEGISLYWPYFNEDVINITKRHTATGNYDHMSNISAAKINGSSLFGIRIDSDLYINTTIKAKNAMMIDLTQMFGSGNEPTLEECKKIFSADFYPYDAGTIKSFPVQTVKSVGKNLFPVMTTEKVTLLNKPSGGNRYAYVFDVKEPPYVIKSYSDTVSVNSYVGTVDDTNTYKQYSHIHITTGESLTVKITSAGKYCIYAAVDDIANCLKLNTHKIQIEKGSTATDYTPYMESTLDVSSFTSDLKSAGSAHDEWSNGKKVKRVGERAYTSGDESESSYITDGTTTYYPLDTPTEDTVPEIDNYIKVDGGGTLTFESDETVYMPVPSTDRFVVDLTSTTEETT